MIEFNNGEWSIEKLSESHGELIRDFFAEDCLDNDEYDALGDYLKYSAIADNRKGLSKTHILLMNVHGVKKIVGFITLRCSSLIFDISEDKEKIGEPAIEIYELGVHKEFQRQGIGSLLVKYAIGLSQVIGNDYIGVRHIVVCAVENAADFYSKFGFTPLRYMNSIPRDLSNNSCVGMVLRLANEF